MRFAVRAGMPVRVPSAILVELYRGPGFDQPVDSVLARGVAKVVTLGARIARLAGHLLASAGGDSALAVDALVVATAVCLGGGMVLSHDPTDLSALAATCPTVRIAAI
jgi:hypothetical protein